MAKAAGAYALALLACLLILVWVLKLPSESFSLHVPFDYGGDALNAAVTVKGIIEHGWYLHNDNLGAPTGLSMLDYPMADNLHLAVIKIISFFTSDYAVVMNLFYLATFPLTVLTSMFVFRRLSLSYSLAVAGSLLFAFLPYHLLRGEWHLFLSAIYVIPLTVLTIVRLTSDSPPFIKHDENGRAAYDFWSLRTLGYAGIALLTGSAGIYYAVFACFFLAVAGAYAVFVRHSLKSLMAAGICVGLVAVTLLVNISPSLIYRHENGPNEAVAQRSWLEAQVLSGTLTQMILPVTDHRLGFLRDLKEQFNDADTTFVNSKGWHFLNENDLSSLGLIGSMGLVFLLGWLVFVRGRQVNDEHIHELLGSVSVLNLFAILLATIGGIGLLIAFFISPEIRAYNRVSIYIGFFSILGVLLLAELLRRRYVNTGARSAAFYGTLLLVLAAGILDQTNNGMVPAYDSNNRMYASDEAFVQGIEGSVSEGAQIFQLPFMPFPESPSVNDLADSQLFRPYLHSRTLRWSYGAMKGRDDDWQKEVSYMPAKQQVNELVSAGFSGIYIDRAGYADRGAEIEQQLKDVLREEPAANDDDTLLFFKLTEYRQT